MLQAERNFDYSDNKLALNMQAVLRNAFPKLVCQPSIAKSLPSLSRTSSLFGASGVAPNHCNARRYLSTPTEQSSKKNVSNFPVPPLKETLEKFLKSAQVHLTEQELEETLKLVKDFESCDGAELQKLLEETAKNERNWLASRWLKTAYLTYRDPVTVFSSPGMAFPTQQFKSDEEFINHAALVTRSALQYKKRIDNNEIPLEKMGKTELDMSQYNKIFGTCRTPCRDMDKLQFNPDSKHFVVIHKNHFFKVPAFTENCEPLKAEQLASVFKTILSATDSPGQPIGILSTDNRDNWSTAYEELSKDPGNRNSLNVIESSLFVVCLDQEVPIKHGENCMTVTSEQLIHGGGPEQNAGNRWMDKTIQIIVNRNGVNGLCYEHSPAEGQPIAIMTDFIINSFKTEKVSKCNDEDGKSIVCRLPFNLNDKLGCYILQSSTGVQKLVSDLEMEVLNYKTYGKEFIKSQKLSPDSYIQMAMQYAFFKLHKVPGAQYESAHLRMYPDGRTETIRSCSVESIRFACGMLSDCPPEERVRRLHEAVNAHKNYASMALQGKGVDRHLLGLKLMALECNKPVPEFYKSKAFTKSAHFRMSTSQVASKYPAFMCYGPLTNDGYGCCYNPRSNDMIFAISSWKCNKETSSIAFKRAMTECLDSMHELLSCAGEKPKSKL